jgi:hypothetical protein
MRDKLQDRHFDAAPLQECVEDLAALDQVLALARAAGSVPGSDASIRHVERMRDKLRSQLR